MQADAAEHGVDFLQELVARVEQVPRVALGEQAVDDGRLQTLGAVRREAELQGHGVCCFEADALDVVGQPVGVVLELLDGSGPVELEDALGEGSGDFMRLQEEHQPAHFALLVPALSDFFQHLGGDARHGQQTVGIFVQNVQHRVAELGQELARQHRPHSLDLLGFQIALDACQRRGHALLPGLHVELASVLGVGGPGAAQEQGFAGRHLPHAANDGHHAGLAFGLDLGHKVACGLGEEGDRMDFAGQFRGHYVPRYPAGGPWIA